MRSRSAAFTIHHPRTTPSFDHRPLGYSTAKSVRLSRVEYSRTGCLLNRTGGGLMREVKVLVRRGLLLSHSTNNSRAFHHIVKSPSSHPSIQQFKSSAFSMASANAAEVKWPAKLVRETFIRFFVEQNGHKFSKNSLLDRMSFLGADQAPSRIFFCCTALRPNASLRQCRYEPVQTYFPRNSRALFCICFIEARCKLPEGK